ncbi:MAG: hypothetical protein WHV67_08500, partial [Thermoanaerobaculia bacterium]
WTKILSTIFGSTLVATGFVLSLYMILLGVGSAIGGKIASLSRKPLKIFGFFEILIGILVIFTPYLFNTVKELSFKTSNILPAFLSFIILSPIIVLMGTTFPIFLKARREKFENYSKEIGIVYGLNLLGGSLGSLFGGFLFLPVLGIKKALFLSGFLDIFAGILALIFERYYSLKEKEEKATEKFPEEKKAILVAFFGGIASLALEVAWIRCLSLFIGSSTYAFTLLVSSFILGLFFGSTFLSKMGDRKEELFPYLSEIHLCFSSTALSVFLISVPFFYINIIKLTGAKFLTLNFFLFLFLFLIFLFPTSLMGFALPLAIKAGTRGKGLSKSAGLIYASSSLGSSLGAILASLILIPNFGLKTTFFFAFISSLMASLIASIKKFNFKILSVTILLWVLWSLKILPWDWRILTAGYYAYAPIYAKNISNQPLGSRNLILKENLPFGELKEDFKKPEFLGTKLLFLKDGLFAQVAVVEEKGIRSLLINGKADASNGLEDMRTQLLLGHLPSLLLDRIKGDACVIGLGSGVTAGAVSTYNFDEIYVIEIEKEVLKASFFFKEENLEFYKDKRVKILIKDARKEIFRLDKKFTLITSEPSNLWMSGTSSLFTYEFFKEIYKKLEEDGIFCQWLHLYQISFVDVKIFLKTINSVFPYLLLYADGEDLLVLASKKEIILRPLNWLLRAKENENLKYQFGRVGFLNLSDFAKNFIMDERGLQFLIKNEKIHRDDLPILEYSAAKYLGFDFSREILKELIGAGKRGGKIYLKDFGYIE